MIMDFDPSTLPPFTYSSLAAGSIRLLVSSKSEDPDGYVWSLRVAHLDDEDLQFDALSYVWGSQVDTYPIIVDSKCARVHHNLYMALPYLVQHMKENGDRPMWIDAICINQEDEAEKFEQIARMHKIYGQAETVWAWLGVANKQDRIHEATELLTNISKAGYEVSRQVKIYQPAAAKKARDTYGLSSIEPDVWSAVTHLLENPWYTRMWIVQEAALARNLTFLCGLASYSYELLFSASTFAQYFRDIKDTDGNLIDTMYSSKSTSILTLRTALRDQNKSIAGVLIFAARVTGAHHHCLLPQDRVYALATLYPEAALTELLGGFEPRLEILYARFAKFLLSELGPRARSFWLWLTYAFAFERIDRLPSWAPDLHHMRENNWPDPLRVIPNFTEGVFKRPLTKPDVQTTKRMFGGRWDELVLKGRTLDEVLEVYDEFPWTWPTLDDAPYDEEIDYEYSIVQWESKVSAQVLCRPSDDPDGPQVSIDVYLRTLSDDTTTPSHRLHEIYLGFLEHGKFVRHLMARENERSAAESTMTYVERENHDLFRTFHDSMTTLAYRQLFLTKDRRLGLTIRGVMPGDKVCYFDGAPCLHVVRKSPDKGDDVERWLFVGDACANGLRIGSGNDTNSEEKDFVMV
ncbi:heterokaryon incompatibility protein-domain-containing protein [Paraphoma chrysanthemicola]|uniref:Heterokaryon incompatibility protein-domain-containing protein n=1 Tax=Paraphoma chrysanthemicola TaxID=798071 RepID=A0A8K0W224_9PLEO|nr:heterokaryon incompatibility protein-domain-containing protein [Paraphoma chrysanthemicola]